LSAPSTIGRYEVLREIGRGAMGIVYEARDPSLGRTVALKVIQPVAEAEELQAYEGRFLTEARVAAALQHPGIVVVHDVGRDPATGALFIALELLRGETLADLARNGPGTAALLLVDARHPGLESDRWAWNWLQSTVERSAIVATKIDKLSRAERQHAIHTCEAVFEHPVLAVSAVELLEQPAAVAAARSDWKSRMKDRKYTTLIPRGQSPILKKR